MTESNIVVATFDSGMTIKCSPAKAARIARASAFGTQSVEFFDTEGNRMFSVVGGSYTLAPTEDDFTKKLAK